MSSCQSNLLRRRVPPCHMKERYRTLSEQLKGYICSSLAPQKLTSDLLSSIVSPGLVYLFNLPTYARKDPSVPKYPPPPSSLQSTAFSPPAFSHTLKDKFEQGTIGIPNGTRSMIVSIRRYVKYICYGDFNANESMNSAGCPNRFRICDLSQVLNPDATQASGACMHETTEK